MEIPVTTAMPSYVRDMIQPAVTAIVSEVRADVLAAERDRLTLVGQRAIQYHGDEYRAGVSNILAVAVGGETTVRTCRCDSCEDVCCEGQCDPCDDRYECPEHECNQAYTCCGYCDDCDDHHGEDTDEVIFVPCRRLGEHRYCRSCEHVCDD